MNKSVESFYIRKSIGERAHQPGPGHYINTTIAGSSPLRGSAHRAASPEASRGFTWGKEDRKSFLIPEDVKKKKEGGGGKTGPKAAGHH